YSEGELARIVNRSAVILDSRVEPDGAAEIARRARGTPRIANRLLRRVRDYAQVKGDGSMTEDIARRGLDRKGLAAGRLLVLVGRVPWIGRLPGDIHIQRGNWTFYFPLATSLLLSAVLTLLLYVLGRR